MAISMNLTEGEMLPSKYLKQSDIHGDTVVTVVAVKRANVARDDEAPEMKYLVQFAEYDKPLVLNSTNIKRMFKLLGPTTAQWIDGQVTLYVDEDVEFSGKVTGGIRIKSAPRASKQVRSTDSRGEDWVDDVPQ